MTTKRQKHFLDAVTRAARETRTPKKRGKPTPENLTHEGRSLGLRAMQASPRCLSKRRDGLPCKAPALKGAKRCLKHGGRVEVPDHPHNMRRLLSGKIQPTPLENASQKSDRNFWDAMQPAQQRELASVVSKRVLTSPSQLYEAAQVWLEVKDRGHAAYKRFLDEFCRR